MINNKYIPIIIAFLIAFAAVILFMAMINRKLGRNALKANQSVKGDSLTYFGSIILFLAIVAVIFPFVTRDYYLQKMPGFVIGAFLVTGLGFLTDIKKMNPKLQICGQIISACFAYFFGIRVNCFGGFFGAEGTILSGSVSFITTVLWIVIIISALNLTNSIEGLSSAVAIIASLCIAYIACMKGQYFVSLLMAVVCGSSTGFLPYNLYPARISIGYSGSQLLGFCLSTFVLIGEIPIKGAMAMALLMPIVVLGLTIVRMLYARLKSAERGISKDFYYRKLIWANFTYKQTMIVVCCINGIMGIVAILYSNRYIVECAGLCAVMLMLFYVLVTNTNSKNVNIKAVNIAKKERKQRDPDLFD